MNDYELLKLNREQNKQLKAQLAAITAERDALTAEVEQLSRDRYALAVELSQVKEMFTRTSGIVEAK